MLWIIYALLHSLFRAMFVETGRFFPTDGWVKSFLTAVFGVLLLLPFAPMMVWPHDMRFYLAATLVSLTITAGSLMQLKLNATKQGRVTSIYMPLEAYAAFMIWLIVSPSFMADLLNDPMQLTSLILAFLITLMALVIVRPNDVSWFSFALLTPVGLSLAIGGVVTKLVLPAANLIPVVLPYVLVNFAVMAVMMLVVLIAKKKISPDHFSNHVVKGGLITALFSTASYLTFVAGVALAPNPGYISFMAMLLPVWMIGLHKMFRVDENASPVAAFLLVIGALILIVGTIY